MGFSVESRDGDAEEASIRGEGDVDQVLETKDGSAMKVHAHREQKRTCLVAIQPGDVFGRDEVELSRGEMLRTRKACVDAIPESQFACSGGNDETWFAGGAVWYKRCEGRQEVSRSGRDGWHWEHVACRVEGMCLFEEHSKMISGLGRQYMLKVELTVVAFHAKQVLGDTMYPNPVSWSIPPV